MKKIIPIEFKVGKILASGGAGTAISFEGEIPTRVKSIVGFVFDSSAMNLMFYRGRGSLHIGQYELVKSGTAIRRFMATSHQSYEKFIEQIEAKNTDRRIRITYQDNAMGNTILEDYTVEVALYCEIED